MVVVGLSNESDVSAYKVVSGYPFKTNRCYWSAFGCCSFDSLGEKGQKSEEAYKR